MEFAPRGMVASTFARARAPLAPETHGNCWESLVWLLGRPHAWSAKRGNKRASITSPPPSTAALGTDDVAIVL
jgi:hypothetical protein